MHNIAMPQHINTHVNLHHQHQPLLPTPYVHPHTAHLNATVVQQQQQQQQQQNNPYNIDVHSKPHHGYEINNAPLHHTDQYGQVLYNNVPDHLQLQHSWTPLPHMRQ